MISVLVVERDPSLARLFGEELADAGFAVRVRPDLAAALADLRSHPVQVLVADEPSMGGQVLCWLPVARLVHDGPVVVLGLDRRDLPRDCPDLLPLPKSSDLSPLIASLRKQALALWWRNGTTPVC